VVVSEGGEGMVPVGGEGASQAVMVTRKRRGDGENRRVDPLGFRPPNSRCHAKKIKFKPHIPESNSEPNSNSLRFEQISISTVLYNAIMFPAIARPFASDLHMPPQDQLRPIPDKHVPSHVQIPLCHSALPIRHKKCQPQTIRPTTTVPPNTHPSKP
jgi:hypothetical protein